MSIKFLKPMFAVGISAAFLFTMNSCEQKKSGQDQTQETAESHEGHDHEGHDHGTASVVEVPDYSNVSQEAKNQIKEVYQSYISLKNGLVESSQEKAQKAAQSLEDKASKVNTEAIEGDAKAFVDEQITAVKNYSEKIASASDIDGQREHLEGLSSSLFALVKATASNPETAYYQFCPMANDDKGGYWLSEKKEIENPYFGESMLKCGESKETLSHNM
ncbi:MAG TPA: DUF3347 domain-containing protein [Cytophagales bacterium]|nr:DUF3347 domain-containing protein [Cytophagales bacterium]